MISGPNFIFFFSRLQSSRNSQKRLELKEKHNKYRKMTRKPRVILEFKYVGRGLLYWRMESVNSHEWVVELVDGCYSRSNGINTTMRA